MRRMWINQPSKFDQLHHLHGRHVLAEDFVKNWPDCIYKQSEDPQSADLELQVATAIIGKGGWGITLERDYS